MFVCVWLGQGASKEKTWALQKKMGKPPKGLMFRYLEKAKKDGRVEAMSMVKTEGHSANVQEIRHDSLERKMISMSKGGSNNQRLLTAQQKKGLVAAPLSGAAAALPSGKTQARNPKACQHHADLKHVATDFALHMRFVWGQGWNGCEALGCAKM